MFDFLRRRPSRSPTTLEHKIVYSLTQNLNADDATRLRHQVARINLVQRHSDVEVCFYAMEQGRVVWPEQLLFMNRADDLLVASVTFEIAGESRSRQADVFFVHGHLFSLLFDRPVPRALDDADATIRQVEQRNDPSSSYSSDRLADTVLPDGAADVAAETLRLAAAADVVVNDPTQARLVSLSHGQFYVLAERVDVGAVGVRRGSSDGRLYLLRYDAGAAEPMTGTLDACIRTLAGLSP